MKTNYIIGIDGGSQSSKVVIFDLEGNIVSEGRQKLQPMHVAEPGIVEHPEDDLWDSIAVACREAMERFPGDPQDIIGLGLCTIRFCRVLLKADGTLASPAISWMDARVSRPYEHVDPAVRYVTTTSGYITHRLTGEYHDAAGNYQGQWPIDTDTWQWSENTAFFQSKHIPRNMLFELKLPGEVLGHVNEQAARTIGIPAGIPVVATANDKAVEALGAGLLDKQTALISLGTYIACMVHGDENPKDTTHFWTNFASTPNNYLYESNGIRRGMWTVSWFENLMGAEIVTKARALGIANEEYMNGEASKVPCGSHGLMTIMDWLAPSHEPFKKGIMIGFDERHSGAHIYRSILEAIALTMKNNTDAMLEEMNLHLEQLVISGGGSNSDLFMQIFADVFNIPTSRNLVNGSASLGAAICTAVSLGAYDSYQTAVDRMVNIRDRFEPNKANATFYSAMNEGVYKHVTKVTDVILKKAYPIFN